MTAMSCLLLSTVMVPGVGLTADHAAVALELADRAGVVWTVTLWSVPRQSTRSRMLPLPGQASSTSR
jgi:hypothetical protein